MMSNFLNQLDTFDLMNDVSKFVSAIQVQINNGRINKKMSNITWFLINSLELFKDYDYDNKQLNILDDDEYQNILNTVTKIINTNYYGFI